MKKTLLFLVAILNLTLAFAQSKKIVVAQNGSGLYKTVQAAFDAIPLNNKKKITIFIKSGTYKEKLHLDATKDFVTLIGEDKFNTILTYDDHSGKVAPSGEIINTMTSYTFVIQGNNFTAENITFQNDAGFSAGQAVAVDVQGDKAAFYDCRFLGNQDVLFTSNENSRQYYKNCYIEGTTDFIFGSSTVWFERCHIHSKKNSHVTAASTPKEHAYGYVFNECVLTTDSAAVNRVSLGRPWQPYASVTYIHCYLDKHIVPEGWDNWKKPENEKTARYAEYKNYGPGVRQAARVSWSRELSDAEARRFTVEDVLGNWLPR